jgi:hypothetical protein
MKIEIEQIGVLTHYPYRMSRPGNILMQIHRDDLKNVEAAMAQELKLQTDNHTGYILTTYNEPDLNSTLQCHNRICYFFADSQAYLCTNLQTTNEIINQKIIQKPMYHRIHADDLEPLRSIDCFLNLT